MVNHSLDIGGFRSWALGNLVDNANRGLFAEWLVGEALDIIYEGSERLSGDSYDLRYGDARIEVKTSGVSQTWNPQRRSTPRFNIATRKASWDAATGLWKSFDAPKRTADVYVFCLHKAKPATNENVAEPACWRFWVIPTRVLDDQLGPQKTVGVTTLDRLTSPVGWSRVRSAVDRAV